ncbi:MAG: helix-turn-helix transcriptional regulator [Streptomyces sp.]|nr:helix-turn-helix transcriptional regulator [Streptomyces sp.]
MVTGPPRRADARRNYERLLEAAEAALNAHGARASLDDIARDAGVGNATLYRHFPTREKLIDAVYEQRFRRLCSAAEERAGASRPGEALIGWLREVVAHITGSRLLGEAFADAYEGPPGVEPPQVVLWHRAVLDAAVPLLTAAQRAGAVRADLDAAELLALTTAVARAGDPGQAGRHLDLLLEGVLPRP